MLGLRVVCLLAGGGLQVFGVQNASQSQHTKASRANGSQSIAMQASKGKHCQAFAGHGIGVVSHYRLLIRAVVVRLVWELSPSHSGRNQ